MQTSEASILTGTIWRNNRLVQVLAALLVVQLILVGVMYFPKGQTTTGGAPLLGDLSAGAITAITVTNEKGETISLEKQGDT